MFFCFSIQGVFMHAPMFQKSEPISIKDPEANIAHL